MTNTDETQDTKLSQENSALGASSREFKTVFRRRWRLWASLVAVALVAAITPFLTGTRSGFLTGTRVSPSSPSSPRAVLPAGASEPSHPPGVGSQQRPTKINGHIQLVVNNGKINVCALITGAQLNGVVRQTMPRAAAQPVGTFDECVAATSGRATALKVAWAVPPVMDPALMFRQLTVNMPASDAVTGMGVKAYCRAESSASQLYVLDGKHLLEVFSDSCAHSRALARIALGRL